MDSRVSARKRLVRECREGNVAAKVVEAISVYDGLARLESGRYDACLLGSGLSTHVAVDFVREGAVASRNKSCAFMVVRQVTDSQKELFLKAGAHGVFDPKTTRRTFSAVVQQAVRRAQQTQTSQLPSSASEHLRALIDSQSAVSDVCSELEVSLCDVLSGASAGLRQVSRSIASGVLDIKTNGAPSLATRDAIRGVFEVALSVDHDITAPQDFDRLFLQALCDWFVDRIEFSQSEATNRLRSKLVSYRELGQ
ncbi:MAG: hypothetical protein KDD66_07630 [Bdellovibrionales bacterium]|nr:hypothetical protein [Bdellovibrionales bacterium]